jgi:hypothetical protein
MVTKTQLYSLNLSAFTAVTKNLEQQWRDNQQRLDSLSRVKARVEADWEGQAAQAAIAKLDALEAKISEHMAMNASLRSAIATYCENKTKLQVAVINRVEQIELLGLTVTDNWDVHIANSSQISISNIGPLYIQAVPLLVVLRHLVAVFEQYDLQAAITSGDSGEVYTTSSGYTTVQPDRHIEHDNDFPHGSKRGQATMKDRANWAKWKLALEAARAAGHKDSAACFEHFRDNSGTPMTIDYEKGYRDDAGIRNHVNGEINGSLQAANEAVKAGKTDITLHSPIHSTEYDGTYPQTENWQRTLGGHSTFTETDIKVEGDTVIATVTVHAKDRWNFNNDSSDSSSGVADADNGRFEELGWAQSFDTSGSMTQTYTWKVGEEPPTLPTNTTENVSEIKLGKLKRAADRANEKVRNAKPW